MFRIMFRTMTMVVLTLALVAASSGVDAAVLDWGADTFRTGKEKIKLVFRQPDGLTWYADAGLGFDSNAFRTSDSSYADLAQAGSPTVNPEVKSGFFTPLEIGGVYKIDFDPRGALLAQFDLNGDFYLDSDLEGANLYAHTLRVGPRFLVGNKGEDTLYVGILVGKRKKLYIDRDDGEKKLTGTTDVSDRYTYVSKGVEAEFESSAGVFQYTLEATLEDRDYEDPVVVSEYDHAYFALGAKVRYPVSRDTKLSAGYRHYVRDYEDRPSRNLSGKALVSNPRLEYGYDVFSLTLRQKLNREWAAYFDYKRTYREDRFVGYNDYTRDKFKVRALYAGEGGYRLKLAAAYWKRDYDNAFAFDAVSGGKKEYDGIDLMAKGELKQTQHRTLWAEANYDVQNTTDRRYEYDRYKAMTGVKWEY